MSYLKPQVSFSLNFASLFSVIRDDSRVLFLAELYMISTKRSNQSAKFQTFSCWCEISSNFYFDRLLFLRFKISTKKVQRSYVSWHWSVMQNLEKNWFTVSKMTNILTWPLKSLENLHFDWFLLCKVNNVRPEKYRRVVFHDNEKSCKIWRKTDLSFGKWHEEFGKFLPLYLMALKIDAKFEGKLTSADLCFADI